jgi:hypothetical protein
MNFQKVAFYVIGNSARSLHINLACSRTVSVVRIFKIKEPDLVIGNASIFSPVFNIHALNQLLMGVLVVSDELRAFCS